MIHVMLDVDQAVQHRHTGHHREFVFLIVGGFVGIGPVMAKNLEDDLLRYLVVIEIQGCMFHGRHPPMVV